MVIRFHPHAVQRMRERGATRGEVRATVTTGKPAIAKFGRVRFRQTFRFGARWHGKMFARKRIDAIAARIEDGWLVVTVIVKFY